MKATIILALLYVPPSEGAVLAPLSRLDSEGAARERLTRGEKQLRTFALGEVVRFLEADYAFS